ncbi:MAG: S-adenosylmethionine decarboxylase proenzyme [Thermoprotei archaeon]|nr:MAG: S-adenosylmethionine decarboxylase proenzyme [Thermoprotei archaeon]
MGEVKELGRHLIAEFIGCPASVLDNIEEIKKSLVKAAREAGAQVCGEVFHKFKPQGVSGIVIIAESHLSIHTWPEYGYAAIDIFTCGTHVDPWKAYEILRETFKPRQVSILEFKRGVNIGEGEEETKRQ